ncbi:zincin-like metallopeptidase domain-containing protein [Bacteroides thetaiotaomicron]|uniref:Zincin-like metallopeptidase domain-containing protein n=1 Tax=Bacteroides thetaiotaomicron TaxID=818 RepID=A0AAP3WEV7_BACT4|nr:zincin-like metallopeptidase domain-containing protein [Bacteroides thetaiotaomicron]MDC2220983.1 zincin-like metallopeptidase domain-containing protein [Bacteroides thetaiotaomicron]MDC2228191.1 zincin-like metallopeptidase domain-containing protein [Bacteroides thetaiotaomicron]MDC2236688.1 zincin-like metallopeptidase domain-containing protein [Bacteroides thetaiotaomicron]
METEYIKKTGLERQKEVLIEALERAAKENGLFLNTNYKQQPHFYNKELQITPVNSLMMAMHSDNGNFKSNAYTTFQNLQANNAAIRRGQKGVPFIWSNLNEYVEIANPENKITKDSFNKLSEEDKGRYRVNPKENVFTLFNLDQTTLPFVHKDSYKTHINDTGQTAPHDEKELRIDINKYIQKMRENLLPIRRDGIGVAHYDANRDLIHIPAQKEFDTYPEYVQAVTREIVRATGVPQRLNREGTMSSDKEKQAREGLVEDLVSAHKLLEFGLPSKLKKTTIENVPSIIKHIKETPNYTENLFRDINRAVGMMKKAEKGEKIKVNERETVELLNVNSQEQAQRNTQENQVSKAVSFEQITILKDDNEKWTLVARPNEQKPFAIHPSKQDISMYFDSLKNPNKEEGVSIRTELAQKYYGLSLQHPELKVDIFNTGATQENIEKIDRVNVFRTKDQKNMIIAYVDGKALQPIELNKSLYQRFWLTDNRSAYKVALAASLYAETLNNIKKEGTKQAQEVEQTATKEQSKQSEVSHDTAEKNIPPIMEQYKALKKNYSDALLLFRKGNYYIAYSDDAVTLSKKLDLEIKTEKNHYENEKTPLRSASFPASSLDGNLPKLIRSGSRVAICTPNEEEQKIPKPSRQDPPKEQEQKESIVSRPSMHR